MLRFTVALLLLPALYGQAPADLFTKAPPAVDEALRARVTEFFQLLVGQKYRQAEALVAEDSKDYFYNNYRPRYTSFEIQEIKYENDFTTAIVLSRNGMRMLMPGMLDKPVPYPSRDRWKLVDGKWSWYVDMDEVSQTPWGKIGVGPDGKPAEANPGAALPNKPSPQDMEGLASQVGRGVRADKNKVTLDLGAPSSDRVTIENGMPGNINLRVVQVGVEGLTVDFEPAVVPARQKAAVVFHYKPAANPPQGVVTIRIRVEPTGQILPVQVAFTGKPQEAK